MKRFDTLAVILGIAVILDGCGGRPIDEELLPTRVPTLGPQDFAVTLAATVAPPTFTPAPVAPSPTPLPVIELATAEPTATTPAPATEALTPTAEAQATVEPSETASPQATETVTMTMEADATAEPTEQATITATETVTATVEAAATVEPAETATPQATETVSVTVEAGSLDPTATPSTPTPAPTATAEPADAAEPDSALAGLPENLLAAMTAADPTRGEQLTLTNGCIGCHSVDPNQVMAGPTWFNVAETAAARVEGQAAALYIYNSILHPNDFVVEGFIPNIMLQIYEQTLSDQDLADIISYLLTLQGQ